MQVWTAAGELDASSDDSISSDQIDDGHKVLVGICVNKATKLVDLCELIELPSKSTRTYQLLEEGRSEENVRQIVP